jgi:putative FmdB family regulatory protein
MPLYIYRCEQGHLFEIFLTVSKHTAQWNCPCGLLARQVITAPAMVTVAPDICYDSPIDGRIITSWAAREEDLKRSNCRPYDPEQKTDYANRLKTQEVALDKMIEVHAEEVTQKMTTAQRGKIYSELTEQGAEAQIVRGTLNA